MPDMTDALNEIGAALAAAGDGEPVELTDEQRTVLASAHTADVLFDIARHTSGLKRIAVDPDRWRALDNSLRTIDKSLAPIAAAWANECRAAFSDPLTNQRITAALATDQPFAGIANFIREDNRLALHERQALLSILDGVSSGQQTMHGTAALSKPAYLSQLSVAGFRGIGQPAELNVKPYRGLTIVYGANGSGKSSFAEALDVLLTGTTGRFAGRGVEWRSAQTNAHDPENGYVCGVFALDTHEADFEPFVRSWTDDGYLTGAFDQTPTEAMRTIGWLDEIDEFKPVLGYAELGPLLAEEAVNEATDSNSTGRRETLLARHLRLRTSKHDPLISRIQEVVLRNSDIVGRPFLQELTVWHRLCLSLSVPRSRRKMISIPGLMSGVNGRARDFLYALAGDVANSPAHPREFDWDAAIAAADATRGRHLRRHLATKISKGFVRDMVVPLLNLCRDFAVDEHRSTMPSQGTTPGWTSRTHVYCEMLIEAIYNARLATLSKQVGDVWRRIRPGSSVQFRRIELRSISQTDQSSVRRASLDLVLDRVHGVERGVLSQGELYSMALSVFLPTMTRPESPFGFAMIDDPVQVMDQYAVEGLARVLGEYANALQLIVFTHDNRLIKALRVLEIDHELINVTRSSGSAVQCERISDPVEQRITDAREEAKRPNSHDKIGRRQDVGDQCRRAIEAACIRAVRTRLQQPKDRTPQDVEDAIDHALQNSNTSTRLLLALAICGDTDEEKVRNVGKFVSKSADWGRWVDRTIRRVNGLAHAGDEETARAVYAGDLHKLIDDAERLTKTIEANCKTIEANCG